MVEHDEKFLAQLRRHEGFSVEAYLCPAGHLTIGWGHNCGAHPVPGVEKEGDTLGREKARELLAQDVARAARELDAAFPWWRSMARPRQGVLLNMAFNMGLPKLGTFKKALRAMKARCWNEAAREMGDSRWAGQVKGRSRELMTQMVLGAWQEG